MERYESFSFKHFNEASLKHYIDIIKKNNYKYLDLNQSKEDVQNQLIKFLNEGEVECFRDLKGIILKSYFMSDKVEINMSNIETLMDSFLNDYILEEKVDKRHTDKELLNVFLNFYFDRLEKATGDYVYCNIVNSRVNSRSTQTLKTAINDIALERGYEKLDMNSFRHLFIRNVSKDERFEVRDSDQKLLLETYIGLIKDYKNPRYNVKEHDRVIKLNEIINSFAINIENRLTLESQKNAAYIDSANDLMKLNKGVEIREEIKEVHDYYYTVRNAMLNLEHKNPTKEDKALLSDFIKRAEKATEALNVKDEDGYVYTTNYYAFMPMLPVHCEKFLRRVSRHVSEEYKDRIRNCRSILSEKFDLEKHTELYTSNIPLILSEFKSQANFNGREVNLSKEEDYLDFCTKVNEYVSKNNLPLFPDCLRSVADAKMRGKEPINIPHRNIPKAGIEK